MKLREQSGCDGPSIRRGSKDKEIVMSIGKRGGNSSSPLLKFDARHGTFFRVDRNATGEMEQSHIADFKAILDLENLEVGWIKLGAGVPPDFKMVPAGHDIGTAPSEQHRQGLRLRVRLAGEGGVAREFSSTAITVWNSIDTLHDEYERNRAKYPGKLPYVRVVKIERVKMPLGVVYAPTFEIINWAVRPAELTTAPPVVADPADLDIDALEEACEP
jgi:hypothetical protein